MHMHKYMILLALCTVACGYRGNREGRRASDKNALTTYGLYIKDSRTNLCFLTYFFGNQDGNITNVPCTPEVEKLSK